MLNLYLSQNKYVALYLNFDKGINLMNVLTMDSHESQAPSLNSNGFHKIK